MEERGAGGRVRAPRSMNVVQGSRRAEPSRAVPRRVSPPSACQLIDPTSVLTPYSPPCSSYSRCHSKRREGEETKRIPIAVTAAIYDLGRERSLESAWRVTGKIS